MSTTKPCRKCLLADIKREDVLLQIKRLLELMPEDEKAGVRTYSERLDICRGCDRLVDGTCAVCGCYVELRAAKRDGTCPSEKHLW